MPPFMRSHKRFEFIPNIPDEGAPEGQAKMGSSKFGKTRAAHKAYEERVALEAGSIASSTKASHMTSGSFDDIDSYMNPSVSGFSSIDDENSNFAQDPAYTKRLPQNDKINGNAPSNNIKLIRRHTSISSQDRMLLGAQPVGPIRKIKSDVTSPSSTTSGNTPPLTPTSSEIACKNGHSLVKHNIHVPTLSDSNVETSSTVSKNHSINTKLIHIPTHAIASSVRLLSISSSNSDTSQIGNTSDSFDEKKVARQEQEKMLAMAEVEHWKQIVATRLKLYGPNSLETARGLSELGAAQMRNKQHAEALIVYKKAARILRQHHGDQSLAVAHALDKVGLAASLTPSTPSPLVDHNPKSQFPSQSESDNLEWGLVALNEAFRIRIAHLGPWHVDVVDTLNNIAGIHLHRRELNKAYDAYFQVLTVRSAVFGKYHPSVAVTAQTLGTICLSMSKLTDALKYFKACLQIYGPNGMNLKDHHPLVQKSFKGIDRAERLMGCMKI